MTNNYRYLDPEIRTRTATYLLAELTEALDPLTEQSKDCINKDNQKLVDRAITLTDLLLERLEDSGYKYLLGINHPKYYKGESVILTSGEKTSIEIIDNSYFDLGSRGWIYELQSDHSTYYPETAISTNL
jgi:hypothetical protein